MRRFLDGEEAPQEYEVHLWEAAVAAPHQQVPSGWVQVTVRVRVRPAARMLRSAEQIKAGVICAGHGED